MTVRGTKHAGCRQPGSALSVVETKVSRDTRLLVLQGLDHWLWALVNRQRLADRLDVTANVPLELAYCMGETERKTMKRDRVLNHPVRLQPDVRRRLLRNADWVGGNPKVEPLAISPR